MIEAEQLEQQGQLLAQAAPTVDDHHGDYLEDVDVTGDRCPLQQVQVYFWQNVLEKAVFEFFRSHEQWLPLFTPSHDHTFKHLVRNKRLLQTLQMELIEVSKVLVFIYDGNYFAVVRDLPQ